MCAQAHFGKTKTALFASVRLIRCQVFVIEIVQFGFRYIVYEFDGLLGFADIAVLDVVHGVQLVRSTIVAHEEYTLRGFVFGFISVFHNVLQHLNYAIDHSFPEIKVFAAQMLFQNRQNV